MNLTFAEKKDYNAINRMYCHLSDLHHEWYPSHYMKTNGLYLWQKRYTMEIENGWHVYIIAKEGRRNIGFCDIALFPRYASIYGIFVEPKYRGQGVATQMIEQAKEVAKKKDYDKLVLHVCNKNPGAEQLYKKLGFKTTEVFSIDSEMTVEL